MEKAVEERYQGRVGEEQGKKREAEKIKDATKKKFKSF